MRNTGLTRANKLVYHVAHLPFVSEEAFQNALHLPEYKHDGRTPVIEHFGADPVPPVEMRMVLNGILHTNHQIQTALYKTFRQTNLEPEILQIQLVLSGTAEEMLAWNGKTNYWVRFPDLNSLSVYDFKARMRNELPRDISFNEHRLPLRHSFEVVCTAVDANLLITTLKVVLSGRNLELDQSDNFDLAPVSRFLKFGRNSNSQFFAMQHFLISETRFE